MSNPKEEDFVQQMDPKAKEPQSGERKWGWIILIAALLGCGALGLRYTIFNDQLGGNQPTQPTHSSGDSIFK